MNSTDDTPNGDTENDEKEDAGVYDSPQELSDASSEEHSHDEHEETTSTHPGPAIQDEHHEHVVHEHEEEGDEEEEDSEDVDDDDDEPALKYVRMAGSVQDLFKKDSASALTISNKVLALGTHSGYVHILDLTGKRIKSFKPHLASVIDISLDSTADFFATASLDGQVVIHSISTPESYKFDMKRPMRSVAMEPDFAKHNTRAFVCGGMAGTLVLREKGWLGHKETTLHANEGPIWLVRWKGRLIAWANDLGVKIYDTVSQTRITFIDRPAESPRADLFKCTLHWQDESTLLIAWADHIKVARIRARPRTNNTSATANLPPLLVEITAIFQLDCMIAGIVHHPTPSSASSRPASIVSDPNGTPTLAPSLTSLLVLAYTPPDTSFRHVDDVIEDRAKQARKVAERPELRIISRSGEELAADALTVTGFQSWGCNDYALVQVDGTATDEERCYVVLSPRDLVVVKPRDRRDHVQWLVERKRYEEALSEIEILEATGAKVDDGSDVTINASEIGRRYVEHLVSEGEFEKAARLCPKVCAQDSKRWENWVCVFAEAKELQTIIPYVPTETPRLGHLIYEMILAYLMTNDRKALFRTIKSWPKGIYDLSAVILAVHGELDRISASTSTSTQKDVSQPPPSEDATLLMECLAELYTANRQPGKALPYFLRLRRPNVLDLIRENHLFTDVQDQVLLLVEFDLELMEKRRREGMLVEEGKSDAVALLVDHVHSIPMGRVVQQLQTKPYYLFLYLDALFAKDPHLASGFADLQVKLYAEFATTRLIEFLRASTFYNLEQAYNVCKERDLVPEMVFLLGRMGNNKEALTLIIERQGDVNRAIDFAKEQSDDDLWEDLLKYSETRPAFIRGLLENVGAEIDPIRLIRRIKLGLEIPGLKEALIKILQDFHLQISLLEGCQTILNGDSSELSRRLQRDQTGGFFLTAKSTCKICELPLQETPQSITLLFLCRHEVHARCVEGGDRVISTQPDPILRGIGMSSVERGLSAQIAFTSMVRARVRRGCPVCRKRAEGQRT